MSCHDCGSLHCRRCNPTAAQLADEARQQATKEGQRRQRVAISAVLGKLRRKTTDYPTLRLIAEVELELREEGWL